MHPACPGPIHRRAFGRLPDAFFRRFMVSHAIRRRGKRGLYRELVREVNSIGGRLREGQCAIAIMAKASLVGTVKTRLVPPLTYEEAAELNTCCLVDTAANIVSAARRVP